MALAVELVGGTLAAVLLALATIGLWLGYVALFGERAGKCPRCGRLAVTVGRQFHPAGCPVPPHRHLEHGTSAWHGIHLRHH